MMDTRHRFRISFLGGGPINPVWYREVWAALLFVDNIDKCLFYIRVDIWPPLL